MDGCCDAVRKHPSSFETTTGLGTGEHLDGHLPGQGLFVLGEVLDAISADFFVCNFVYIFEDSH